MRIAIFLIVCVCQMATSIAAQARLDRANDIEDIPVEIDQRAVLLFERCNNDFSTAALRLMEAGSYVLTAPVVQQGSVIGINQTEHVTRMTLAIVDVDSIAALIESQIDPPCVASMFVGDIVEGSLRAPIFTDPSDIWGLILQNFAPGGIPVYASYYNDIQPLYVEYGFHDTAVVVGIERVNLGRGIRGLPTPDVIVSSQVFTPQTTFPAYRADPRFAQLQQRREQALSNYINFVGQIDSATTP